MPTFLNSRSFYAAGSFIVLGAAFGVLLYRRKIFRTRHHGLKLPPVFVISSNEEWGVVAPKVQEASYKTQVLGLDCEWKANRTKGEKESNPVALLQLATSDDICVLIRLNKLGKNIPEDLQLLLKDKTILKVGVAVNDDSRKLMHDHGLVVEGCLDLRHLVDRVPKFAQLEQKGLKSLAGNIVHVKMKKSFHIRLSDWDAEELTHDQVTYAAEDALVSALIFKKLMSLIMLSWPERFVRKELDPKELHRGAVDLVGHLVDHRYRATVSPAKGQQVSMRSVYPKKQQTRAYTVRQSPLYDNCQLQAPDGEPLCSCDARKAIWYLERNLADLINKEPLVVRLRFEPAGRPTLDNKFYTLEKENKCVVCGREDSLVRKTVVPHEYRRFFPQIMKNHLSHDVLLLCSECHLVSNQNDSFLREQLALECNASLGSGHGAKTMEDPLLKKVKSAGRALLHFKEQIPESRKEHLLNVLKDFYQVSDITDPLIHVAAEINIRVDNENFVVHGEKVVQHMSTHGGLLAFESRWRKHFLDTMKPKFLPEMWSVDHNHQRLALQVAENKHNEFDVKILGPLPIVTGEDSKEVL